jgi:hypothetical protein
VQTDSNPAGAIRGQLSVVSLTATPFIFRAPLSAANEVPPIGGPDAPGLGVAIVAVVPSYDSRGNITGGTAKFEVVTAGLPATDEIIFSHIHSGTAVKNGPIVVDSGISPASPIAIGSQGTAAFSKSGMAVSEAVMQGMLATASASPSPSVSPSVSPYPYSHETPDASASQSSHETPDESAAPSSRFYFNVHTNLNPAGAIRAQLTQAPIITSARVAGKNLVIAGFGFQKGSVILVNGQPVTTKNDATHITTSLTGKKAGALIALGATVVLVVQNPDMVPSPEFSFYRTQ